MQLTSLLKYAGILVAIFLTCIVALFFLYPYLDEEGYDNAVLQSQEMNAISDSENNYADLSDASLEYLENELEQYSQKESSLLEKIDSLTEANARIKLQLDSVMVLNDSLETKTGKQTDANIAEEKSLFANADEDTEDFAERVKSLLNLDEEELAPIVNQMSNSQLVRLYKGGGNIQREKLLRSLESERAAELMTEIM